MTPIVATLLWVLKWISYIPLAFFAILLYGGVMRVFTFALGRCEAFVWRYINLVLLHLRISLLPFFRIRLLRLPAPVSIATPDILPHILIHLAPPDLARCCRVSHLFLGVAGKTLYGSPHGVLVGKRRYYAWYDKASPAKHVPITSWKRSLLAGLQQPEEYDVSNLDLRAKIRKIQAPPWPYNLWPTSFRPFLPSKLKLELLHHVRHLIYTTDMTKESDTLDSTSYFPLLHTLTIQHIDYLPHFEHPFLANLRPRHIRLTHLRTLKNDYATTPYPLYEVGSQADKVTLHFMDCDRLEHAKILWPESLKQLDVVLVSPAVPDTRVGQEGLDAPLQSFDRVRVPIIPEDKHERLALALVMIAIYPLILGAKIRIIGLGGGVRVAGQDSRTEGVEGEEQDETFSKRFKAEMFEIFKGTKGDDYAAAQVAKVGFVTLSEYMREKDTLPF